jgi:hypothetical protein
MDFELILETTLTAKNWHSDQDITSRKYMIFLINQILGNKNNFEVSKKLEVFLYMTSSSFHEYSDTSFLREKIGVLVEAMICNEGVQLLLNMRSM